MNRQHEVLFDPVTLGWATFDVFNNLVSEVIDVPKVCVITKRRCRSSGPAKPNRRGELELGLKFEAADLSEMLQLLQLNVASCLSAA